MLSTNLETHTVDMDYKYIECLISRYFQCETSVQEEQILRNFFMQEEVPAQFRSYQPLFRSLSSEAEVKLPADFVQNVQSRISHLEVAEAAKAKPAYKARIIALNRGMRPFYKAVACVALIITVGTTSSHYWSSHDSEPIDYNYSNYHDTYSDPEVACEKVTDALKDLSDAFKGETETPRDTVDLALNQSVSEE